jgi:transcription elongation GreA/GreB family factor
MNKAFVKESDDIRVSNPLPDRPIPPQPNLVTASGLAQIEEQVERLEGEHAAARAAHDPNTIARTARDLRYWIAQRVTAHVVPPPATIDVVQFGSSVVILRDDGRRQVYRIVGIDEADPTESTLSHISPLAKSLIGREVGDVVKVGATSAKILEIN